MPSIERRINETASVEIRGTKEKPIVHLYAAVFNSPSLDLGGFTEIIRPGAFDAALKDPALEVDARVQHEGGLSTIGSTANHTLSLGVDSRGLWADIEPPDTSAGRDIVELIGKKYIRQSSFAFSLRDGGEKWDFKQNPPLRELTSVNLHDVAPVTGAAYPATSAEVRELAGQTFEHAKRYAVKSERNLMYVKNEDGRRIGELYIYNVIDTPMWADFFRTISGQAVVDAIQSAGDLDHMKVFINSPGGDAFESVTILNVLRRQKLVTTYIDGLAASGASIIAMAGNRIVMGDGAFLMIHRAAALAEGNGAYFKKLGADLDKIDLEIGDIYAKRSGLKASEVMGMMIDETWIGSREAVEKGFADAEQPGNKDEETRAMLFDMRRFGYSNPLQNRMIETPKPQEPICDMVALRAQVAEQYKKLYQN